MTYSDFYELVDTMTRMAGLIERQQYELDRQQQKIDRLEQTISNHAKHLTNLQQKGITFYELPVLY